MPSSLGKLLATAERPLASLPVCIEEKSHRLRRLAWSMQTVSEMAWELAWATFIASQQHVNPVCRWYQDVKC